MTRILHVTCQKPDSTGSGVYLSALVKAFAEKGHENAVVCGVAPGDVPSSSLVPGTSLHPVAFCSERLPFPICGMSDVMPYESTRYRDLDNEQAALFEAAFREALLRADEEFQPDLVICHHLYFVTAIAREVLPHRRIMAVCHSTDLLQLRRHNLMGDRIRRRIAELDAVGALSEAQREEILELFEIDPECVSVVGTGYDASLFHADGRGTEAQRALAGAIAAEYSAREDSRWEAVRREAAESALPPSSGRAPSGEDGGLAAEDKCARRGAGEGRSTARETVLEGLISGNTPMILYVGKIGMQKGVASLLNAFAQARQDGMDAVLVLAGGHSDATEYRLIREQAERLAVPVLFTGAVPGEKLAEMYRAADVLALASFFEGIPLVFAEALASGCSVVSTDLPGIGAFYDCFVPHAPMSYVEPPAMKTENCPVEAELPAFEERFARALAAAVEAGPWRTPEDSRCLEWGTVADCIFSVLG